MKTIKAFVKRHPLLSFYALAFAIYMGRHYHGGRRTWRNPGSQESIRDAVSARAAGVGSQAPA